MSRNLKYRDTRHITLARALHARLYVNVAGRIFVAGGRPAHEKLSQFLARQDCLPTAAEAPSPSELGITTCDGELNRHLLHCVGSALSRWEKALAAEQRRRPAQRRKAPPLNAERQEIAVLKARLQALRQWQAMFAGGGEPEGAPYFLDPGAENELQTALREVSSEHPLTPLVTWQARVVRWLSGNCALRRFLAAVVGLLRSYPQVSRREQVRGFQRAVVAWKQRSEREQARNLLAEIRLHIQRLSPDVVREGKFSARLRGRSLGELCDHLLSRCNQLLLSDQVHRWHVVPAALAALTAADGSTVSLPRRCFQAGAEQEDFAALLRTIGNLAEQIGQPGYDALLAAIDHLPQTPHEFEYGELCELLAKGNLLADAAWVCEQELLPSLKESCLSAAAARRLSEKFARCGWPLSASELGRLICHLSQPEHQAPVAAWLAWLGSVTHRTITPRILQTLKAAFWQTYLPSVRRHRWFNQIAPCLAPPRRCKILGDATALLERISAYQQLAGNGAMLPKSLRKLLEHHDRRQREREHLRTRSVAGMLDAAAQSRLLYLECSDGDCWRVEPNKLRRAAEEAFLLVGLAAQGAVVRRLAESKCRVYLGDLVPLLDPDQLWDFAGWIEKMSDNERQRLRTVITARNCHGRNYKRYLVDNQPWIAKALLRGVDLEPWFMAEPHVETIGGRAMEICLASDLHEIFLMGAYFGTCLSPGDINDLSVLANAYDANKQVVFMFTRDDAGQRQVVARQLIAMSSDFKVVGYRCYMSWRHAEKSKRDEGLAAMAAYSGRLARECGLELADHGTPEEIGDHFWYDDGECKWPAAAQAM
jgi:hypothetical protein